jgi:ubiquitin conjugation factor E4 B
VSEKDYNHELTRSLPLPAEPPMAFRLLPEYFIDNVVEYLEFLAQ